MIEPQTIDLPTETSTVDHNLQDTKGQWVMYRARLFELQFQVHNGKLWVGGRYRVEKFVQVKNRYRSGTRWQKEWGVGDSGILGQYIPDFNWEHDTYSFLTRIINDGLKKGIVLDESFVRHVFAGAMNQVASYREEFEPTILGKLSLARTA